jgi:hypothetical protein
VFAQPAPRHCHRVAPIKAANFHDAFAGDLPRKTTDLMYADQRPFSVVAFSEPSDHPAWKTIPSWCLVSTKDHAIPPKTQQFMAKRAGSTISYVRRLPRPGAIPAEGRPGHDHECDPRRPLITGAVGGLAGPSGWSVSGA